jgi:DNA-binding response OmpR family regulator
LIVDDEPSVLDGRAGLLTDEGYAVQTASDGRAALVLMAADLPLKCG